MAVKDVTMGTLCKRMARVYPDRVAFVDGDTNVSFDQFHNRTNQLANVFVSSGVKKGDRVAVLLFNGLPMMELYFAAAKIGALLLPLNWRLAPPEIDYILQSARPKLFFYDAGLKDTVDKMEAALPTTVKVPAEDAPLSGAYADFLNNGDHSDLPETTVSDDPWVLLYTSGTTGRPKGCLISHRAKYVCNLGLVIGLGILPDDRYLCFLPLFHVAALGLALAHFSVGGANVMLPRPPEPEAIIAILSKEGCTSLSAPPPLLKMIIDVQKTQQKPLKLRWLTGYGGGEPGETIQGVRDTLGAEFYGTYGQSESGNFVAALNASDQLAHPASCGRVLPHLDVQIQDDDGVEVPRGDIGEVCLRGPSVMNGYWEQPTETEAALQDGWLHTGDMARMDREGFLYIVDRKKDLVKTGGENVYPREVELRLSEHPDIVESSIVGVPDAHWGEAVKAFVVLKPGASLKPKAVADWCRGALAGYKRPRYVEFISELPRSQTGKIEKKRLREYPVQPDQSAD